MDSNITYVVFYKDLRLNVPTIIRIEQTASSKLVK